MFCRKLTHVSVWCVLVVLQSPDAVVGDRSQEATPSSDDVQLKHEGGVFVVRYSRDGRFLATAASRGTIRVWDAKSHSLRFKLDKHEKIIWDLAFHPSSNTLASCSGDKTIRLWDLNSGEMIRLITRHKEFVRSIAFSPDGKLLASGSGDQTTRLWETATGTELAKWPARQYGSTRVAFSADGKTLMAGTTGLRFYDLVSRNLRHEAPTEDYFITDLALSPDGRTLAVGGYSSKLEVNPDGSKSAYAQLHFLAASDGRQLGKTLKLRTARVIHDLAFSPDGNVLAAACTDKRIRIWNVATRKELKSIAADDPVLSIDYSVDGGRLAWSQAHHVVVSDF